MPSSQKLKKSSISSPNLSTFLRPKSSKSVRILCEPAVRYFDSNLSIVSENSRSTCDYRSNVSSSAMDSLKCGDATYSLRTGSSDFYCTTATKCKF